MMRTIEASRSAIAELCERLEVLRLGVFGSTARDEFRDGASDIDVLVLFDRRAEADYLHRYLALADGLEALFERKVDIVTEYSAHSPVFRAEIERDLIPLYERPGKATAA